VFDLLLLFYLVPVLSLAVCFAGCVVATARGWTGSHTWALVVILLLPALFLLGAAAGPIAAIVVPSGLMTAALGRATRSLGVGVLSVVASVGGVIVGSWEGYVLGIVVWAAAVCGAMVAWTLAVRRAEPWRREPLRCRGCGYHMHGLKEPVCPECGRAWFEERAPPNSVLARRDERMAQLHRESADARDEADGQSGRRRDSRE
jgi:hypothetical protein